jgi:hypothetical protein
MATKAKVREAKISNPTKVFWPEEGYTKLDLANFYLEVFDLLEPYVKDRILTLERCPDGLQGQCFFQKEKPESMPEGTPTKKIASKSSKRGATNYVVGGSLETQLALVNLGCIPIHVIGSRANTFPKPDWVCFDLDPGSGNFREPGVACVCSNPPGPHRGGSPEVCREGSGEAGFGESEVPDCGALDRGARKSRLSGSVSQWIGANSSQSLLCAPETARACVHAAGMVRSEDFA